MHWRAGVTGHTSLGTAGCPFPNLGRLAMVQRFRWTAFDVTSLLPPDWPDDIKVVAADADFRDFPRTPVLSREAEHVRQITCGSVHAAKVQQRLPWLYKLYRRDFLELARQAWGEPLKAAFDDRFGIVLNVHQGNRMRFECHVDSNPVTGLLFFTDHPAGGGELVVGHDPDAVGVEALEKNGSVIRPQAGQLIFFDGKTYPHYARTMRSDSDVRVVAVMNFYTESCPESTRPSDLNRHLFGEN
jgi:hypothetical protein